MKTEWTQSEKTAFETGYLAYGKGINVQFNPFGDGSDEFYAWEDGWYDAQNNDPNVTLPDEF